MSIKRADKKFGQAAAKEVLANDALRERIEQKLLEDVNVNIAHPPVEDGQTPGFHDGHYARRIDSYEFSDVVQTTDANENEITVSCTVTGIIGWKWKRETFSAESRPMGEKRDEGQFPFTIHGKIVVGRDFEETKEPILIEFGY